MISLFLKVQKLLRRKLVKREVSIDINGVESTTMNDNLSKGLYPAAIHDWTGQYPDPEAYLKPLLSCSAVSYTHLRAHET